MRVSVMKEYNIKINFDTNHSGKYSALEGHFRSDKVNKLKSKLNFLQSFFTRANEESENNVCVSYMITEEIAKCRNHFADGDFVKECLQSAADVLYPSHWRLKSYRILTCLV
ncbi:hypothetical protein TNCT_392601 [Trichonephila clavata]|uniref:Uncharacterized protein n=1 Tax=Trichonephila clavata TaxID=2740835 RepID=A0A8X6FBZ3_TRICU|nr:hypothetical protein TNCT_392601 [Trichonephila clavata]